MQIQKIINNAVSYVDNLKTYTKAAKIIDDLLKAFKEYSKRKEIEISELEMTLYGFEYYKNENDRLKKILKLHGIDETLNNDEILFLQEAKQQSQFYTGNTAREIIYQYIVIDAILKKHDPKKETRPRNIEQIQKGFEIITQKYGY